ncbi:MAG: hypothetical protein WA102_12795 [Candidatus Methanoperedens sp.]
MVVEKMLENKDWSYYISLLQNDQELDENQKKIILDGWIDLKQIFDDAWIKTANKWHPLLGYLKNQALWSRLWLACFGKRISELKGEVHDELKQRLLQEDEFKQAYAEIEVASKFKENGYNAAFVKRKKKGKTPDILVEYGNRKLCVEVTMKFASEDWIENRKTYMQLVDEYIFQYPGIKYFCTIHKSPLSTPKIKELKEKIKEKIEKVKETGYEKFVEPNVFECYICTDENISRVPLENRIIKGPKEFVDGSNQIRRIRGTIKEKVEQLCNDKPNILVIYENSGFDLVIPFIEQNRIRDLVNNLDETVNEFSQLSALVVIWSFMGTVGESIEEKDNYIFSKRMEETGGIAKYMLIIKNRYPSTANCLTSEEIELIKKL